MASLIFLSLLGFSAAAPVSNNYFQIPAISYGTPSGRPGSDNLDKVFFNVTDVAHSSTANCDYSWSSDLTSPTIDAPAVCNDTTFSWYFGKDAIVDDFEITVKHEVKGKGCFKGTSQEFTTQTKGASYECGGSGVCNYAIDGPIKIHFE